MRKIFFSYLGLIVLIFTGPLLGDSPGDDYRRAPAELRLSRIMADGHEFRFAPGFGIRFEAGNELSVPITSSTGFTVWVKKSENFLSESASNLPLELSLLKVAGPANGQLIRGPISSGDGTSQVSVRGTYTIPVRDSDGHSFMLFICASSTVTVPPNQSKSASLPVGKVGDLPEFMNLMISPSEAKKILWVDGEKGDLNKHAYFANAFWVKSPTGEIKKLEELTDEKSKKSWKLHGRFYYLNNAGIDYKWAPGYAVFAVADEDRYREDWVSEIEALEPPTEWRRGYYVWERRVRNLDGTSVWVPDASTLWFDWNYDAKLIYPPNPNLRPLHGGG